MYRISWIILFILFAGVSSAQVKLKGNPLIPDNIADPSVVSFNGKFYLYGTTDIDQGLKKGGPPVVWKSDDFINWHFEGLLQIGVDWNRAYTYKDKEGQEKIGYFRYWAPGKVIKKANLFYLYVTIVKPNDELGTYVLKSDRPEGPFNFTNGTGIYFNEPEKASEETKPLVDDIDGDPFMDDDGKGYIYWRRRKAAALSDDLVSVKGKTIDIPTKFKGYSEGPGLFKRKGIYYYFYTLSGHASYSNGYMMSSDSPLGPFKNPAGKNIFIYSNPEKDIWGPGHGNVFHLPGTDAYYFIYLEYGEGGTTRQVYASRIYFNTDGTIIPVNPDHEGVGALIKIKDKRGTNIASQAKVTASSFRLARTVNGTIAADEDSKLDNSGLPEKKVTRIFNYKPENTADQDNATRWRADTADHSPWIQYDLGKEVQLKSCEMSFVLPVYGQAWQLEKSSDGQHWETCAEQKDLAVRSPHIAAKVGKARFLRLHILKGEAGLWEMKIFN